MFVLSIMLSLIGLLLSFVTIPVNWGIVMSLTMIFLMSIKFMSMNTLINEHEEEIKKLKQHLNIPDEPDYPQEDASEVDEEDEECGDYQEYEEYEEVDDNEECEEDGE